MALFEDLFRLGTFKLHFRSSNSTKKKGGAEELKDFKSISLVGGLYKLRTKVLANRLKSTVGVLVSTNQHVFIRGRQILDATLITNEVVDSKLKANVSGLLLKLDIEKAFDHVNWD